MGLAIANSSRSTEVAIFNEEDQFLSAENRTQLEQFRLINPSTAEEIDLEIKRVQTMLSEENSYQLQVEIMTLFYRLVFDMPLGEADLVARSLIPMPRKRSIKP